MSGTVNGTNPDKRFCLQGRVARNALPFLEQADVNQSTFQRLTYVRRHHLLTDMSTAENLIAIWRSMDGKTPTIESPDAPLRRATNNALGDIAPKLIDHVDQFARFDQKGHSC